MEGTMQKSNNPNKQNDTGNKPMHRFEFLLDKTPTLKLMSF